MHADTKSSNAETDDINLKITTSTHDSLEKQHSYTAQHGSTQPESFSNSTKWAPVAQHLGSDSQQSGRNHSSDKSGHSLPGNNTSMMPGNTTSLQSQCMTSLQSDEKPSLLLAHRSSLLSDTLPSSPMKPRMRVCFDPETVSHHLNHANKLILCNKV